MLKEKGPLLLACNHPNSFLDAVILDILFEQPVWSLARGDAFSGKTINKILTAVKILPVYRTSEGVENGTLDGFFISPGRSEVSAHAAAGR